MKKISGYDKIQESGTFKRLAPGGYVVKLLDATDVPEKEYLRISFDVCEGDNKGFFANEYKNDTREDKKWPNAGTFIRSYKEKALPMLKGFTVAVEKSNSGYVWNFDEKSLKGKIVGLVLGEEEFVNSVGKLRTRTYVESVRSVDSIRNGDFTIPALKTLDPNKVANAKKEEPFLDPFSDSPSQTETAAPEANPFDDSDSNPFA